MSPLEQVIRELTSLVDRSLSLSKDWCQFYEGRNDRGTDRIGVHFADDNGSITRKGLAAFLPVMESEAGLQEGTLRFALGDNKSTPKKMDSIGSEVAAWMRVYHSQRKSMSLIQERYPAFINDEIIPFGVQWLLQDGALFPYVHGDGKLSDLVLRERKDNAFTPLLPFDSLFWVAKSQLSTINASEVRTSTPIGLLCPQATYPHTRSLVSFTYSAVPGMRTEEIIFGYIISERFLRELDAVLIAVDAATARLSDKADREKVLYEVTMCIKKKVGPGNAYNLAEYGAALERDLSRERQMKENYEKRMDSAGILTRARRGVFGLRDAEQPPSIPENPHTDRYRMLTGVFTKERRAWALRDMIDKHYSGELKELPL